MAEKIRESVIAGSWYPGDAYQLRKTISGYLEAANPPSAKGDLVGLISPRAGYAYSGGVAAHAYKLLAENPFDRILIVAPSHRAAFSGSSIYNRGGYRTPLGVVPLDPEIIDLLFENESHIKYVPHADAQEHSLEIQLPFLQTVLPKFTLVPITMGDQGFENCSRLADAVVAACRGKRVLMIASTDPSHYHSYSEARRLDAVFLDRVGAFDPEGLARELDKRGCEACGAGPVLTVMLAARQMGADTAKVLHYATSGDVSGDRSGGVVGYMAGALYKGDSGATEKQSRSTPTDLGFSAEDKKALHELAYRSIRNRCFGEPMPETNVGSPKLRELRGAFVCIHKGKDLRGCIGIIEPRDPLCETIRKMAVEAAFGDPRFCALAPDELDSIDVEISVLTPLRQVRDPAEIEIGTHGIYIRKGYNSGLLLPQVAVEHGWDRLEFLEWTCKRAGLAKNAWKDPDTDIHVFSADVF